MRVVLYLLVVLLGANATAQIQPSDSALEMRFRSAEQYLTGVGKQKDVTMAVQIFRECAEQGSAKAMNALGILYKTGTGVIANGSTAESWFLKAGNSGYPHGWYNLGLHFKNMAGSSQDFFRAFECFEKGEDLGDEQSKYYLGYMYYKGFGCVQNYHKAAAYFKSGATVGKANSMYFLGLCFRNGYGIDQNIDSAKYWLEKAVKKGYRMAMDELSNENGENSNVAAKEMASKLVFNHTNNSNNLNEYKRVENSVPANQIEGLYVGYMIRYDWSGKHPVNCFPLKLQLQYSNGKIVGKWIESDSIEARLAGYISPTTIVFQNTKYERKDHYSQNKALMYSLEEANLRWVKKEDSVYLSGNVQMFSIQRNEPEKPVFITLTRAITADDSNAKIKLTNEDGSEIVLRDKLTAYPNPFTDVITIDFELKAKASVETDLLTSDGKIVYTNKAGVLDAGFYTLPIKTGFLAAGTYILRLKYGNQFKTVKVVKQ